MLITHVTCGIAFVSFSRFVIIVFTKRTTVFYGFRNTFIVVTVLPDLSKIDCEPEMDFLNDYFSPHIHVAKRLFIIHSFFNLIIGV